MTILRRINIKIMLLIGHSLEEIVMSRDTVIFLLQHLGFVINWKKSVLTPEQEIEFLDLTINSVTLELFVKKTKIQKVVSKCQNLLNNPQTSILELTRLIGLLMSTIQAVLPARLNCRFLQIQQISPLSENLSYLDIIVLNQNSKIEQKWWVQNLELCNGRALIQPPVEVLIQTDASTKGWEQRAMESKQVDGVESQGMAIKLAIQTFLKTFEAQRHSTPVGQHGSFDISVKDEVYPEFKTSPIKKNMGSSSTMWDHSYCRIPSDQTERDSRLGVKKQFGLLRVEAGSPVILENLSTEGNPRDRSISFHIISSYQDLLFVEAWSIEPGSRCLPTKLIQQESICFSSILHDLKSFEENPERQSTYDDPCNYSLAITAVAPEAMRMSV